MSADIKPFRLNQSLAYQVVFRQFQTLLPPKMIEIFLSEAGSKGGFWRQRYHEKDIPMEDPNLINAIGVAIEIRDF